MRDYFIYGAGYNGKIVKTILDSYRGLNFVGWLDDKEGYRGLDLAIGHPTHAFIVAIMNNNARVRIAGRLRGANLDLYRCVDWDSLRYFSSVAFGNHICIYPNVTLMPDVRIGEDVMINTGCIIEHDNVICDGAYISPGVTTAGKVTIGKKATIGTGAVILPHITIGENSYIGAGSVVTKNVPANVVAYGNPCRVIRKVK